MKKLLSPLSLTVLCFTLLSTLGGLTGTFAQTVTIADSTINCTETPMWHFTAVPSGAQEPVYYVWYNSAWQSGQGIPYSGNRAWPNHYGTFHVIMTDDNSAVDTATITITYAPFSVTLTPVEQFGDYHVSCEGRDGEVQVNITGGTGPYCISARYSNGSLDTCITGTSFTLTEVDMGDCHVTVTTNGGHGCKTFLQTYLEEMPRIMVRLSGQLYPNGHYVSCDTCADGTFTISAQGATGEMMYAWLRLPPEGDPDWLVGRATLSMPFEFREGHEPDGGENDIDPSWILALGPDVATIDSLRPDQWYFAFAIDELGCADFKPIYIEKPRPAAGAWHTTGNTADSTTVLGTVNEQPLRLATNDTVRVTIAPDGAVGIGTDEVPEGYLMAVNGRIIAEEIEVKLNGDWPDFVFEEGYHLPPLDSVNGFIQQNGHLPGFPSASQMQQRGSIASGQMVTALVQKVEELTLYVIQLQQQVQALQKQGAQMDIKVRGLGQAIGNAGGNGNGNPGGPGNGNGSGGN